MQKCQSTPESKKTLLEIRVLELGLTCSATRCPKNLETGTRLRASVTMMKLIGLVVKRRMLSTVFLTALRKCSARLVVLARLITTMARLMCAGEGWLTELGERRGAEIILARLGNQGAEALCEVDWEVGEGEDGG